MPDGEMTPPTSDVPDERSPLTHKQVVDAMQVLADSGVLNLDVSMRQLIEPLATRVRQGDLDVPGGDGDTQLHIVCCDEYGLVTK